MKTKAIQIHATGTPEVMRWEDLDVGAPEAGEVLLRQTAIEPYLLTIDRN